MKGICKFILLPAFLAVLSQPASAGLREDVECLSAPFMEGRAHASRGGVEASAYLVRRFAGMGYAPLIMAFRTDKGVGRNIVVVHRGDTRSDKYTLVCAYYDALGCLGGAVYPGADSNASGVAVMLNLAEELKGCGKNFVFAALDAHSEAIAGAEALAAAGDWKFSMVVNLDTIGSTLAPPNKYRPDFLIVLGGKKYEKSLEAANQESRLRLYYDYYRSAAFTDYFYKRASDQAPFLRKGIPCLMFTSGITMNTNKTTDSCNTLDYDILSKRGLLILKWLLASA